MKKTVLVWVTQFVLVITSLSYLGSALGSAFGMARNFLTPAQALGGALLGLTMSILCVLMLVATLKQRARRWWVVCFLWLILLAYPIGNLLAEAGYHPPPPQYRPQELAGAALAEIIRYLSLLALLTWWAFARRSSLYIAEKFTPMVTAAAPENPV